MASEALSDQIARLLATDGSDTRDVKLVPCNAGGNNRVFKVIAGDRLLIAKWYFSDPSDKRNRLAAEYAFLCYAARVGIACVPAPISCDAEHNLALYEFIKGESIGVEQVAEREVDAALDFFLALNQAVVRPHAASLADASEACFTISGHLALVDERIERLMMIVPASEVDAETCAFVAALKARWQRIKSAVARSAPERGIELDAPLPHDQRCISPSDFGFHNALRRPSGDVCFLDFEYAGWDDPAKMAGDFFSHPAISVDPRFREHFLAAAMSFCAEPQTLHARAGLLFPLFQMKWCCIILNDFLPDSARRRRFADPGLDELERKRTQLAKAVKLFNSIEASG
jgi:hypothetical protein